LINSPQPGLREWWAYFGSFGDDMFGDDWADGAA